MIFTKILQKMLKQDLTLQILKSTDHYLKEKIIKNDEIIKNINNGLIELGNSISSTENPEKWKSKKSSQYYRKNHWIYKNTKR